VRVELATSPRTAAWHARLRALACAAPLVLFAFVYGRTAGLGFLSDDFGWIRESRFSNLAEAARLFTRNHGFYRPLVALSFGVNHAWFGLHAAGYGLTNLLLALGAALCIRGCLRSLGLPRGAAWTGACLWLLNPHGINMAILWISGRTSLLLVLFSAAAAWSAARRRVVLASLFLAAALFSKEEAVMLPAILAACLLTAQPRGQERRRALIVLIALSCMVLTAYFLLRHASGALTAASAPVYYRFTFAPPLVGRNLLEYLDRACTFPAAVVFLAWLVLRPAHAWADVRWRIVMLGVVWYVAGYAITTFLPVRSSLYACFPSVGSAIVAAEILSAWWAGSEARRRTNALIAVCTGTVLLAPVYVSRTHRWADLAQYSRSVLDGLSPSIRQATAGSWVVLVDHDRDRRVNVDSAFGSLVTDAVSLTAGKDLRVWVEPALSPAALAVMTPPCEQCERLTYHVRDGQISR